MRPVACREPGAEDVLAQRKGGFVRCRARGPGSASSSMSSPSEAFLSIHSRVSAAASSLRSSKAAPRRVGVAGTCGGGRILAAATRRGESMS